jgi:hypothetical protein
MALIDAIRAAVLRTDGSQIGNVFGSSSQVALEMADLANDVARDIALSHDWRALMVIAAIIGDGVTEDYTLPDDFDRMTLTGGVQATDVWLWGYHHFGSIDDYMHARARGWKNYPGGWFIVGRQMHFEPAPKGEARFPYIRQSVVDATDGTRKATFSSDDDVFSISERLLTLGLIWRWKSQKGLQYAEDMQTYELALSKEQARDRGARFIGRSGTARFRGAHPAWPWELG